MLIYSKLLKYSLNALSFKSADNVTFSTHKKNLLIVINRELSLSNALDKVENLEKN
ncbi:hypothetical protein [Wukongibacter sp. M2B1]|uniref:hypothetical protein n=1 Tax=Wukongibacter sp. M2B1 TaxID=3088895 RepID=UPI003D78E155